MYESLCHGHRMYFRLQDSNGLDTAPVSVGINDCEFILEALEELSIAVVFGVLLPVEGALFFEALVHKESVVEHTE